MKLQTLRIEAEEKYLQGYGKPTTTVYVGTIKFRDTTGNIEAVLSEEQIQSIVTAVGGAIVDATKKVADAMVQSIAEEVMQQPQTLIAS